MVDKIRWRGWAAAPTTIDQVCHDVSAALDRYVQGSAYGVEQATLSIKIQNTSKAGGGAKFEVCGVPASAKVVRKSRQTHTVLVTFQPNGLLVRKDANPFDTMLGGLSPLLGPVSGCDLEKVVIDIDYSMTDTGSVSALAVGAVKDDSTHHLTVAFAPK